MASSEKRKFRIEQCIVFALTFISYASFHACRQSFANAKKSMQENWEYTKHEEGAMDAIFLFSYAFGLYASGYIGDLFDASKVHSFGLFMTGIIFILFASLIPYFNIHSLSLFTIIWIFNGLIQSLGWPTAVKLVANWFNTKHDGVLFGVWASNQCIGNIIGAGYVTLAHIHNYPIQWMFYLPAIQAIIVSIIVVIFVKTNPPKMSINALQSNTEEIELAECHNNQKHYERIDNNLKQYEYDEFDDEFKDRLSFWEILKLNNLIIYSVCFACLKAVNYTMFFWLPFFESNHFTQAESDYLEIYYNVGQVFGGLICGYISDRFSRRTPTVIIFLIIATIPIFLLRISTLQLPVVTVLVIAAGFFIGGPSNLLATVMGSEIAKDPKLRGNESVVATVAGIIDGSGSVGAAITQYVVSIVSDISLEIVFIILASLLIAAAILLIPSCIRDIKGMYRNYWRIIETEIKLESPGGKGRDLGEHKKLKNDSTLALSNSQDIDIDKIIN